MPKIQYIQRSFRDSSLRVIYKAEEICQEYARQGFDLTLRQLYYQFVSRGLIANKDTEYDRLGSIINDARLAGYLDWDFIVDRTRNLRSVSHWGKPSDIIDSAAHSFRVDKWASQLYRPEVWIEKDALVGVIERICVRNDVPFFSCRGYTSQSELWGASQRLLEYQKAGQQPVILHLGDHDPSGIDMTRDIFDRMLLFIANDPDSEFIEDEGGVKVDDLKWMDRDAVKSNFGIDVIEVNRLALHMEQVRRYNPPPNPAKLTDARAKGYVKRFGESSWELDALEPTVIARLIQDAIDSVRDEEAWEREVEREKQERLRLATAAKRWGDVTAFLEVA